MLRLDLVFLGIPSACPISSLSVHDSYGVRPVLHARRKRKQIHKGKHKMKSIPLQISEFDSERVVNAWS